MDARAAKGPQHERGARVAGTTAALNSSPRCWVEPFDETGALLQFAGRFTPRERTLERLFGYGSQLVLEGSAPPWWTPWTSTPR